MDDVEAMEQELVEAVRAARARGWRDADLRHAFRRERDPRELFEHLDEGIEQWRVRRRLTTQQAGSIVRFLLVMIRVLPAIPPIDASRGVEIDASVLGKVRALLAKAESTEFEPEAEALYAKAHDLMTRYSIDHALIDRATPADRVSTRRVLIEEPYAYPRFILLARVAEAFDCRVMGWCGATIASVFGMAEDVEATELLYTSLLLQATTAMLRADSGQAGRASSSVAAFRRAFLIGFAKRVGARLR